MNFTLHYVFAGIMFSVVVFLCFAILQMKKEKNLLKVQNQLLKEDNQLINSQFENVVTELSSKMLQLANIQDIIERIKKQFTDNPENNVQLESIEFKTFFKNIDSQINSRYWDDFYERYDELHNDFLKKITNSYPELTVAEIKLCALIRLNLSSKEICALTNRSLRTVENIRYRIRKKMKVDRNIGLSQYILSI